jgi:hypothetical protein
MAKVKEGDWVYIKTGEGRLKAFVLRERYDGSLVIHIIGNRQEYLCDRRDVVKMDNTPDYEDLQVLIDIALDTKDEKWFRDLVSIKYALDIIKGRAIAV